MKIIFFGSDDFAATHLETLVSSGEQIVACVTQPDKPKGRGMHVVLSPIKELAIKHHLPCLQPDSLKDPLIDEQLKTFQADLFVVIAYGKILPPSVLDIPKIMPINVHGSLLPKYRGAAPINFAVMNGDNVTGLTVIKMNNKMDEGDMIAQKEMRIKDDEDAATLRLRMAKEGAGFLLEVIDSIKKKAYKLTRQNDQQATYASKLTKDMGKINWNQPAAHIHNLVRGLQPWPGAYTFSNSRQLKLFSSSVVKCEEGQAGEILQADKQGLLIKTGKDAVLFKDVQPESSKRMAIQDYLLGHALEKGAILEKGQA
jgi:methionyl-tRNA formyltransferase